MNGLLWQYHHDHILKGRFFGRVDVCEFAWCDCFFPVLHVLWLRRPQEMTRGPSGFKLSFLRLWDLRTLVFVEMCFLSWHVTPMSGNRISIHGTNRKHEQYANVRKQNLESRNKSETRTIFMCRIRGSCFLRDRACCY